MSDFALSPPVAAPGTRAVGYTLRTKLFSLDDVRARRMEAMAERWGWDLLGTWQDDSRYMLCGAERPEFTAMVGELRRLGVGVVLVPERAFLGWDANKRFDLVRRIEAAGSGAVVSAVPRVGWLDFGIRGR